MMVGDVVRAAKAKVAAAAGWGPAEAASLRPPRRLHAGAAPVRGASCRRKGVEPRRARSEASVSSWLARMHFC